jgi:hypothetical protein
VLPDSYDAPAGFAQLLVRVSVADDVAGQFVGPPLSIRDGDRSVLRTLVPEATIHEHGNTRPSEHEISSTGNSRKWCRVDQVSKSTTMEFSAQLQLLGRVPLPSPLHALGHGGCRSGRTTHLFGKFGFRLGPVRCRCTYTFEVDTDPVVDQLVERPR